MQVDDFRIAGGIVALTIALGMRWVFSAAFPRMVGPGTITTLIVLTGGSDGAGGYVAVAAALVIVVLALLLVLWSAPAIGRHMSQTLRVIMTRLMGRILAAVAVEMVVAGLQHVCPQWVG